MVSASGKYSDREDKQNAVDKLDTAPQQMPPRVADADHRKAAITRRDRQNDQADHGRAHAQQLRRGDRIAQPFQQRVVQSHEQRAEHHQDDALELGVFVACGE